MEKGRCSLLGVTKPFGHSDLRTTTGFRRAQNISSVRRTWFRCIEITECFRIYWRTHLHVTVKFAVNAITQAMKWIVNSLAMLYSVQLRENPKCIIRWWHWRSACRWLVDMIIVSCFPPAQSLRERGFFAHTGGGYGWCFGHRLIDIKLEQYKQGIKLQTDIWVVWKI